MADGVQDRFAHRALCKGWQLPDEEPCLEGLTGIATGLIDLLPDGVMPREEAFLKLQTQLCGPRGGRVAEFIDQFGLSKVPADRWPGAEKNQRSMDQRAVGQKQLGVAKQLFMAEALDALGIALPGFLAPCPQGIHPCTAKSLESGGIEIAQRKTRTGFGGEVPTDLFPDGFSPGLG